MAIVSSLRALVTMTSERCTLSTLRLCQGLFFIFEEHLISRLTIMNLNMSVCSECFSFIDVYTFELQTFFKIMIRRIQIFFQDYFLRLLQSKKYWTLVFSSDVALYEVTNFSSKWQNVVYFSVYPKCKPSPTATRGDSNS